MNKQQYREHRRNFRVKSSRLYKYCKEKGNFWLYGRYLALTHVTIRYTRPKPIVTAGYPPKKQADIHLNMYHLPNSFPHRTKNP